MDLVVEVNDVARALGVIRSVLRDLHVPGSTRIRRGAPPEAILGVYDDDVPKALGQRPPRRPKWKPRPGEVVAIRLGADRWAYARVTPQKDFFEFFDTVTSELVPLSALAAVSTFRIGCLFDLDGAEWPHLGVLPYASYDPQVFRVAYAACPNELGPDGFLHCGHPDYSRTLSESEVATIPSIGIDSLDSLRTKLERRFKDR
jgi:hypothetical protein